VSWLRSSRRRGATAAQPLAPERVVPPAPVYAEGCYLVSAAGEAATWAVYPEGHWGLIYECDGRQILSAWVRERDVPLHVLAEALPGSRA
jgi:hypothetical protein